MRRIAELDGLRAVAILLVLGCHYTGFAGLAGKLPEFGWIGVDVFFVLSGFLITTILLGSRNRSHPYKTFYSRRAIRIFPPYFLTTAAIIVIAYASGHRSMLTGEYITGQLLFLQAFHQQTWSILFDFFRHPRGHLSLVHGLMYLAHHIPAAQQGVWPSVEAMSGPFWSLSIEEYFYVLWAPIVLMCSRRAIVWIGVAVCVVEILLRWVDAQPLAYFDLFLRFDALVYGALLALLMEHWRRKGTPRWAARLFLWLIAICLAVVASSLAAIHPVLGREIRNSPLILAIALPAFCVAVVSAIGLVLMRAGTDWQLARLLRSGPLQYIGTISYTMYLVHLIASDLVLRVAKLMDRGTSFVLLQNVVSVLLTIAIARASWHYVERPLLKWKDRRFPGSPHPPEPALK